MTQCPRHESNMRPAVPEALFVSRYLITLTA